MHTSVVRAGTAKAPAVRYLSCLRPQEIVVLQGPPLVGAAIAIGRPSLDQLAPALILLAGNLCLVAHIFVLNDWSNLTADRRDPNKAAVVFTARGVGRGEMGVLAAALLLVSFVLFGQLGPATLLTAAAIAALSTLYSLPRFDWKGTPLLNSTAHLAGGTLHFLLGYSVGHAIDARGLTIASFCAVTFAAGHLAQELRDHDGDVRSGIQTNAVVFGRRWTFVASLALFTLSQALLTALALAGFLPRVLAGLALLYPLQLRWWRRALREGLTYRAVCGLQRRYRALYAGIGAAIVAALWLT